MEKTVVIWTFCWFSTFLKNGSYSDLPLSIKPDNIIPMIAAGIKNIRLLNI
jgi:malate dehydrogenase (quinone)